MDTQVWIAIQWNGKQYEGQLISLSETELCLRCSEYIDQGATITFFSKQFRGTAVIKSIQFAQLFFNCSCHIEQIEYLS